MYLISRSAGLTLPIRSQKTFYVQSGPNAGDVDHVVPALTAEFRPAGFVPPFAREAVSKLPNFGLGMGMYESGEREDPYTRCGALDTDLEAIAQGWSDEDKLVVEQALMRANSNGIEYIIVEAPAAAKPWPKYDDIDGPDAAEQIAFYVNQLGVDPGVVKVYELENRKREDVVAAMDREIDKQNEDVVGVISA